MRRLLLTPLLSIAALLAACGTVRLSYDHADWLLARMAGRYVDLNEEQSRLFRARLTQFHSWHRVEELPVYAATFDEAADRLAAGLTRADVEWAIATVRARAQVLGVQAAEELAPVLATLSAAQLRAMEQRFTRDNAKFFEAHLSGSPAHLVQRRSEWLGERFEDWVGKLSAAQRTRIAKLAEAFPEVPALRLEERKRRQAVFLGLMRQPASVDQLRPRLAAFLSRPDADRSAGSRRTMQAWERRFVDMVLELDASLTAAQRETALAKLRGYSRQFGKLAERHVAGIPFANAAE